MYRGQTADEALDALKREADASEKAFLDHLAGRTGSGVDPDAARLAATATYEERLLSGPNDPRLVVNLQAQWLRDRPRQVEYLQHVGELTASLVELESRADQTYQEALEGGVHQAIAAGIGADVKRLSSEAWEPRLPKEKAPYGQAGPPGRRSTRGPSDQPPGSARCEGDGACRDAPRPRRRAPGNLPVPTGAPEPRSTTLVGPLRDVSAFTPPDFPSRTVYAPQRAASRAPAYDSRPSPAPRPAGCAGLGPVSDARPELVCENAQPPAGRERRIVAPDRSLSWEKTWTRVGGRGLRARGVRSAGGCRHGLGIRYP